MGRLTVLKQIAADIASQFGPDCEVVIHDLKTAEPEHSIVYIINGHVISAFLLIKIIKAITATIISILIGFDVFKYNSIIFSSLVLFILKDSLIF